MLWVIVGALGVAGAVYLYLVRERLGVAGMGLAALRSVAFLLLLALLANVVVRRPTAAEPATVALDASLSMLTTEGAWLQALDTARALAGPDGLLLRFGNAVTPFDTTPPEDGRSRVGDVLGVAAGRGGPAYVVTDGELEDADALAADRRSVRLVLLPRAVRPGLAVTEATVPERALARDSIPVTVELTTWGGLTDTAATLTIRTGERTLIQRAVAVPPSPGRGRRTVVLPPGRLPDGTHVLEITVQAPGDPERQDDTRLRLLEVATLPAAVLVASPLDWEARFLARELGDLVPGGVEAFGELGAGRWVDLRTQQPVAAARVDAARRGASVVLLRGGVSGGARARRLWRWLGGGDAALTGDWYVVPEVPTSPFVGRLAGIRWDSVPPLYGVMPQEMRGWTPVLSARLGRRGAQRVIVAARDSAGRRELITTAAGSWRWAFRGGADREAYRTLVAAGLEWLLADAGADRAVALRAEPVVPRGVPVAFRWLGDRLPDDSVALTVSRGDRTVEHRLVFDAGRTASLALPPGVYRWETRAPVRAAGIAVVEAYSPEFVPRPTASAAPEAGTVRAGWMGIRDVWWGFGIVMVVLLVEWAWRVRRGLP